MLYGLLLALGGAKLFELVGVKGDLGALVAGVMLAAHPRSGEIAKTMLSLKDLFLLGFFLSIGLTGEPTLMTVAMGLLLVPFILVKALLFYGLFTGFKLRARTALLTSLHLMNYSEFGLIVTAAAVASGWIGDEWLLVLAIAVAGSFAAASVPNANADRLYRRFRPLWMRLQRRARMPYDRLIDPGAATIAIIGMGRVGSGAYEEMRRTHGDTLIGVDSDPVRVREHKDAGRKVLTGDPSDADFWERFSRRHTIRLLMLALPTLSMNRAVLWEVKKAGFEGSVAAIARFPDEVEELLEAGATTVFNIYTEAGAGFAAHVVQQVAERDAGVGA